MHPCVYVCVSVSLQLQVYIYVQHSYNPRCPRKRQDSSDRKEKYRNNPHMLTHTHTYAHTHCPMSIFYIQCNLYTFELHSQTFNSRLAVFHAQHADAHTNIFIYVYCIYYYKHKQPLTRYHTECTHTFSDTGDTHLEISR